MTTMKDLLEKAITGVIKQGNPSMYTQDGCGYRGIGGAKCAVGMLIGDVYYNEALEGRKADHQDVVAAVEESNDVSLSEGEAGLLCELQRCHDKSSCSPNAFSEQFKSEVTGCVMLGKLPRYCLDFL